MSHKFNLNILKLLYRYIITTLINNLITIFLTLKDILMFLLNIIYTDCLLNFNYKKLFVTMFEQVKSDIYDKISTFIRIMYTVRHIIYKYILNYSFIQFCIKYFKESNIDLLILHIFNKLDTILFFKNKIKFILKFIKFFIIYLIDTYYYNLDTFYLTEHVTDKNYNMFFKTCFKLQKWLKIKQFKFSLMDEWWSFRVFFKPSLYKNYTSDENLELIYSLNLV